MDICISGDLEDIEDLMLPDSVDAHQNKKYVLPRALRHKTSTQQQACADSVIPGFNCFCAVIIYIEIYLFVYIL